MEKSAIANSPLAAGIDVPSRAYSHVRSGEFAVFWQRGE